MPVSITCWVWVFAKGSTSGIWRSGRTKPEAYLKTNSPASSSIMLIAMRSKSTSFFISAENRSYTSSISRVEDTIWPTWLNKALSWASRRSASWISRSSSVRLSTFCSRSSWASLNRLVIWLKEWVSTSSSPSISVGSICTSRLPAPTCSAARVSFCIGLNTNQIAALPAMEIKARLTASWMIADLSILVIGAETTDPSTMRTAVENAPGTKE